MSRPVQKPSGPCCDREHRVVRHRSAGYCGQPPPVTGAGRGELEGTVRVSEIPAKATESEDPSDGARADAAGDGALGDPSCADPPGPAGRGGWATREATGPGDAMWQSSPPGSIYDYIKVASFSIGPDGLVDQWSLRAEQLFGISAERAVGMDPIEAFVAPDRRELRPPQDGGDPRRPGVDRRGPLPDAAHRGRPGRRRRPRRGLCDADHDRGRRAGRRLHRRRRPHPPPDRDRPRRLAGDFRPISVRLSADRHGPAGPPCQPAVRLDLRRHSPTTTAGAASTTICRAREAERVSATLRRVLETGDSITDMHVTGHVPGSERAPSLVHQPLPRAQRQRPPHRHRLARNRHHRPPRRSP